MCLEQQIWNRINLNINFSLIGSLITVLGNTGVGDCLYFVDEYTPEVLILFGTI